MPPASTTGRASLVAAAVTAAQRHGIVPTEHGGPEISIAFEYALALDEAVEFDARYHVAFEYDGSVTLVVGPGLPSMAALGIKGGYEHSSQDVNEAIDIARACTVIAAEIRAKEEWSDLEDTGGPDGR